MNNLIEKFDYLPSIIKWLIWVIWLLLLLIWLSLLLKKPKRELQPLSDSNQSPEGSPKGRKSF